jgi:hypothetical protein
MGTETPFNERLFTDAQNTSNKVQNSVLRCFQRIAGHCIEGVFACRLHLKNP